MCIEINEIKVNVAHIVAISPVKPQTRLNNDWYNLKQIPTGMYCFIVKDCTGYEYEVVKVDKDSAVKSYEHIVELVNSLSN